MMGRRGCKTAEWVGVGRGAIKFYPYKKGYGKSVLPAEGEGPQKVLRWF